MRAMEYPHLTASREWTLIRDGDQLTSQELDHLRECYACYESLSTFLRLARACGFQIKAQMPELHKDKSA